MIIDIVTSKAVQLSTNDSRISPCLRRRMPLTTKVAAGTVAFRRRGLKSVNRIGRVFSPC